MRRLKPSLRRGRYTCTSPCAPSPSAPPSDADLDAVDARAAPVEAHVDLAAVRVDRERVAARPRRGDADLLDHVALQGGQRPGHLGRIGGAGGAGGRALVDALQRLLALRAVQAAEAAV